MAAVNPPIILAVDDDDLNLKLLGYMLGDAGYKVCTASSALQAVASVEVQPPDLILLDVMMPEMDGFEVLEQLKANVKTKSIPVVMLTSLSDMASRERGTSLGATHFLSKPTRRVDLLEIVNGLVGPGATP